MLLIISKPQPLLVCSFELFGFEHTKQNDSAQSLGMGLAACSSSRVRYGLASGGFGIETLVSHNVSPKHHFVNSYEIVVLVHTTGCKFPPTLR